jgi:hypothetical protein
VIALSVFNSTRIPGSSWSVGFRLQPKAVDRVVLGARIAHETEQRIRKVLMQPQRHDVKRRKSILATAILFSCVRDLPDRLAPSAAASSAGDPTMPDSTIAPTCKNCGNADVVKMFATTVVSYSRCAACGAIWVTSSAPSCEREWDVTSLDPDSGTLVLTIRPHL